MSDGGGYVYFIRPIGMDGPIKIGCSVKPLSRLIKFSAWSPFPLELIGSVPGSFADENRLHRRFSDLHTSKEWFMSSPLLRDTIERILAGASVKDACRDIAPKKSIRNQKRPLITSERKLFLSYGNRIRKATRALWRRDENGNYHAPDDIKAIMHNWRRDQMHDHLPITPTVEQFAQLEAFIADPKRFCIFRSWGAPTPSLQVAA
jgi:hypothetical protein